MRPKIYLPTFRHIATITHPLYGGITMGFEKIGPFGSVAEYGEYWEGGNNGFPEVYIQRETPGTVYFIKGLTDDSDLVEYLSQVGKSKIDVEVQPLLRGGEPSSKKILISGLIIDMEISELNAMEGEIMRVGFSMVPEVLKYS